MEALEDRNERQARDVFDLSLLLRRDPALAAPLDPGLRERAAEVRTLRGKLSA